MQIRSLKNTNLIEKIEYKRKKWIVGRKLTISLIFYGLFAPIYADSLPYFFSSTGIVLCKVYKFHIYTLKYFAIFILNLTRFAPDLVKLVPTSNLECFCDQSNFDLDNQTLPERQFGIRAACKIRNKPNDFIFAIFSCHQSLSLFQSLAMDFSAEKLKAYSCKFVSNRSFYAHVGNFPPHFPIHSEGMM